MVEALLSFLKRDFLFLLLLLARLDFLLLFLHVLEIPFECSFSQPDADVGQVEQILYVWSVGWIWLEHPIDDSHELLRILFRNSFELSVSDLERQRQVISSLERR